MKGLLGLLMAHHFTVTNQWLIYRFVPGIHIMGEYGQFLRIKNVLGA